MQFNNRANKYKPKRDVPTPIKVKTKLSVLRAYPKNIAFGDKRGILAVKGGVVRLINGIPARDHMLREYDELFRLNNNEFQVYDSKTDRWVIPEFE